jgi:hypothetical protein
MTNIYAAGPVSSVDEAIDRMDEIDAYIAEHEFRKDSDGVACFNHLYGVITRRVRDGIAAGLFQDSEFLTVLDVQFANRFFEALRFSHLEPSRTPKAWKVLIERRSDDRIDPLQFAVAGVNAHINLDLSVSMLQACRELDAEPGSGTQRTDYLKVNDIFDQEMRSLRQFYQGQLELAIDNAAAEVLDLVGSFAVEQARDAAWEVSEHLWLLDTFGIGVSGYLRRLDGLTAYAGNLLLTPLK